MKTTRLLQIPIVLTLLFGSVGTNQPVRASTDPQSHAALQIQSSVSITVLPALIAPNESATVTVSLSNVPAEGYTSAEFNCIYPADLVQVSDIVLTGLFGPDSVPAISGPRDGLFIVGVAGSRGNRATAGGPIFTFHVKALATGQVELICTTRVSDGSNVLTGIGSASAGLMVMEATVTPTIAPTACDKAEFVADINVPPGTVMLPGTQFTKTWRLKNVGSCIWTTSYRVKFVAGEQMNAPASVRFPVNVAPGQTFDISLYMTAPSTLGSQRGYWILHNDKGEEFGIGLEGNQPWFVDIVVSNATPSATPEEPINSPTPSVTPAGPTDSPTPTPTSAPTATPMPNTYFDFVAQAHTATWSNAAGQLPYPGIDGSPDGFAFKVDNPRLETGAVDTRPGLLMVPQMMGPQNAYNLYIQGSYPPIHVQSGDRFQSTIGCEGGATNCYLGFRLDYQVDEYPYYPRTFWGPFLERYDGQTFSVNIDLSSLAGKDVKFILTVFADGATAEDRALWVAPIIYRPNPTWTPTPSATPAADWPTFTNTRYGFAFKYPPPGPIIANNDTFATIHLPFVQGTVLQDKSLLVTAYENVNACMGAFPFPQTSENVTINGLPFLKQTGQDRGATYLFRWTSYSTLRNNVCVSLNFILDSLNPGTPATPPAAYDEASESAIFEQIVATYRWLEITPTATPTLSPTPTPSLDLGTLTGQVHAGKPVTLSLYRDNSIFVTSTTANADGTFNFTLPAGTYLLIARSDGFLGAQGFVTITAGNTSAIPAISLPPGDIDGNNLIDQYDVLTIGMNYNTGFPPAADLNNDGIINVLDLELLAQNYRKTGPVAWQ